ncbi:uncharacterized protein J4E84_000664 [Alternaria hordeiaustralica]|uniref:uncharacterized protein n=1 Tax=Alternaria hordeiaustralica TaxID=1187925 RepID=UPI0020C36AAB|nr:uncharacterized protein J4E84_000664 [Alternaria hordeiaustralica]KAI4697534.1 hypothetical protein J4E84_000664 [Alternaria hordeiaustralica]
MGDGATHQKADRAREIVVEALTRNVKEDHVREIFGKYGVIKELTMPMNPTFNINRGIAYILYEEIDDAERAIAKMHDAQLDGAKIQVSIPVTTTKPIALFLQSLAIQNTTKTKWGRRLWQAGQSTKEGRSRGCRRRKEESKL